MANTKIEWTEKSWNPVSGCSKVSSGCKNCYAETIANRFWEDRKFTDVQCHPERLDQPLHWKKPSMIFVNSMSDLFHEKVPFEFIEKVFRTIDHALSGHVYQILTKRPQRMKEFIDDYVYREGIRSNVWLGVSVENQQTADEKKPILQQTPAAVRFISYEPGLERVDFGNLEGIDWLIIGAESGAKRRPFEIEWAEYAIEQCRKYKVASFVKQVQINGKVIKDINLFPENLKHREYPKEKS